MNVINFGSLNLDWVYQVPNFVQPGETLSALSFNEYLGGKGLNQSIALTRAGAQVAHVGAVGHNGAPLREALTHEGVNTDFVATHTGPSGHAVIQVNPEGENAIVIFPGSNQSITSDQIKQALSTFPEAQAVLLQNETNALADIMQAAKQAQKTVFYNPAPMLPHVATLPLECVDVLILNQIEAEHLTELHSTTAQCNALLQKWPHLTIVLTQGSEGVTVATQQASTHYPAVKVESVLDTTAAGDTFIGYFMAEYLRTQDISQAITLATRAASLCIQQHGAAQSIPHRAALT